MIAHFLWFTITRHTDCKHKSKHETNQSCRICSVVLRSSLNIKILFQFLEWVVKKQARYKLLNEW
jgi:hypothetical protein